MTAVWWKSRSGRDDGTMVDVVASFRLHVCSRLARQGLFMRLRLVGIPLFLGLFLGTAFADTIYVYTGSAYDTFSSAGFHPSGLSGSFTVASPLGDNLAMANISPTAFSFTDGFFTLTNSTPYSGSAFLISTDSLGNITAWSFQIGIGPPGSPYFLHTCSPSPTTDGSAYTLTSSSNNVSSMDSSSCLHGDDSTGQVVPITDTASVTKAGSWSQTNAVPEPASCLLVGTGLVAIIRRRRVSR
jgi:hypothetical protein